MNVFIVSRGMPNDRYPLNGIFEFDQAKALASIGHNVSFMVLDFRSFWIKRKWGYFHYKKDNVNVFEISIPIGRYRKSVSLLQYFASFLYEKMVQKVGQPDVVHSHFFFISHIANVFKNKYKLPFVITEHTSMLNKELSDLEPIDVRVMKAAFHKPDKIITVSESLQKNLKQKFNRDSTVVYNVIDTDTFSFVPRKKKKEFVFVSIGFLIPRKGFDLLINAFHKAQFDSNVKLLIIGEGKEKDNLQSQINQYQLSEQIQLLGAKNRDEIMQIMQNSDSFVLASNAETFGVVYIEAMLTGLPVIATICGGPENFITENEGILIPKNDELELTKALQQMHKTAYNYNAKAISEYCYHQFSPKNIALQITEVYKELL